MCRGSLDDVIGVVAAHTLLPPLAQGLKPDLNEHLKPPVFVPETLSGMELLEHFRASPAPTWCSWSTSTARCRA